MKSKFTSIQVLLVATIVFISTTSTRAQTLQLQNDWTYPGTGTITNLQNMTVLEDGDRYVAEDTRDEPGSHGFNIVKYDNNGVVVWRRAYVPDYKSEHVKPIATAYNAGAIFVLGNMNDVEVRVIKFSGVNGSKLREDPHGGIFTHSGRGIVADPVGTGVIATYMIRYTDPSYFGQLQHQMYTIKYDADLNEVWEFPVGQSLGLLDYTQNPTATPRAITADSEGNTYVTGVLDVEVGPPGPPYLTGAASTFTLKYNRDGVLEWPTLLKITEPSITNYGYDNDYDATGTYMVHQSASSHYDDGPPLLFGRTVLTKRNLDGTTWTRSRPSMVRDLEWRDAEGPSIQKDVLVVDKITSSAYIAYDDVSASVALEKYDAEGDLQWPTQHISIGESTSVESVILDKSGNVVVGVNNDVLGNYSIYVFAPNGHFIDNIDVPGMVLKQLSIDGDNNIHAIGTITGSTTSYFVSRFSYEPTIGSIPVLVKGIDLDVDLFAFDPGECWTGPFINWNCLRPPFCFSPKDVKASLSFQGKTVWESTFVKPIDTTFPESKDFRTFSLKVNDGQMFQEVLLVDDKLVKNGVTQLSFKTKSIDGSVDLNIKTDGAQIPVTISLLNAQGKVLWKEQFMAPFQKQISEKFNEPVASISINGPEDQISITYYPNPSNGAFTVELDPKQSLPVELSVYDMQGFRIHQQMLKEPKSAVSLSGKKPGLYVLQIKNGVTEIRELIQIK